MKLGNKKAAFLFLLIPSITWANEISREQWMQTMSNALPAAFCRADQYFRACFRVTLQECETTALSTVRVCLENAKAKIPATLDQPKDGTHWGSIIGQCAGESYEIALKKKRIDSKKCNNPDNWK